MGLQGPPDDRAPRRRLGPDLGLEAVETRFPAQPAVPRRPRPRGRGRPRALRRALRRLHDRLRKRVERVRVADAAAERLPRVRVDREEDAGLRLERRGDGGARGLRSRPAPCGRRARPPHPSTSSAGKAGGPINLVAVARDVTYLSDRADTWAVKSARRPGLQLMTKDPVTATPDLPVDQAAATTRDQ